MFLRPRKLVKSDKIRVGGCQRPEHGRNYHFSKKYSSSSNPTAFRTEDVAQILDFSVVFVVYPFKKTRTLRKNRASLYSD
jgi:hypothetical protein